MTPRAVAPRLATRVGFTLLEAVVAMAILGVVAIGALGAYAAEARAALRERHGAPAVAIARERLAQLELLDAHALRTLPDSAAHGTVTYGSLSYEWRASAHRVTGEPDLYDLSTDVRWSDGAYTLRTRSYRPGIVEGTTP